MKKIYIGIIIVTLILGISSVAIANRALIDWWADDQLAKENKVIEAVQIGSEDLPVYYSPDKQFSVSLELTEGIPMTEYLPVIPVLSVKGKPVEKINLTIDYLADTGEINPPVVWLNNNQILFGGKTIYNVQEKTFNEITFMKDIDFLGCYAVNPQKTKLAVSGRFKGKQEHEVGYVELKTNQYKKVYSFLIDQEWTEPVVKIGWDSQENLYFDAPEGKKPIIKKYDGNNVSSFVDNAMFPQLSPEGSVIAFVKSNNIFIGRNTLPRETVLLDLNSKEEVLKLNNDAIAVWGDDDSIAGLSDFETIRILDRKEAGKIIEKRLPRFGGIIHLKENGIEINVVKDMPGGKKKQEKTIIPFS